MSKRKDTLLNILSRLNSGVNRDTLYSQIMCGEVVVNGSIIKNPKEVFSVDSTIEIIKKRDFVSRGGVKLEHALASFEINVKGRVFIDAGASTGGFTDCLLKEGARLVYAVDVGYNQLDFKLRNDSRVMAYERKNIMDLNAADFPLEPDEAVCDLSFRSIRKAARHIIKLTKSNNLLALVKPQFEWLNPPEYFKGVVERPNDYFDILKNLLFDLKKEDVHALDFAESPIRGAEGNREFFFLLTTNKKSSVEKKEKKQDDILMSKIHSVIFE